jgi:hypothetical protein
MRIVPLLLLATIASAADAPLKSPAKIIGVTPNKERTALVIRYEISGTPHEKQLLLQNSITDFRYCPWMGNSGIAFVICTGGGWTAQYYYSAFHLTEDQTTHRPVGIPAPPGSFDVLGIGNTGGESLIITAVRRVLNPGEPYSGWLYSVSSPQTNGELPEKARGHVIPFEVPAKISAPAK